MEGRINENVSESYPLPADGQRRARSRETIVPYETRLNGDLEWALSEGSLFFEGKGAVQSALRKITRRLDALGVPYAVSGGMALFVHGFRRFTEDVDLLVNREGLKAIHEALEGRGYVTPFTGSKNLRDTEFGVRIEFLIAGGYPGDGKPKPVSFPEPKEVGVERDGVKYLSLPVLVELKLASGMTQPDRLKDVTDVIELIKLLNLKPGFAEGLNPFVRPKFLELCGGVHGVKKKYMVILGMESGTAKARDLDEMIGMLHSSAETLEEMRRDGVTLDPGGVAGTEEVYLVTTDPDVARKYDMHAEDEFWGGGGEGVAEGG